MSTILSADWHIGDYRNGPTVAGVNGRLLDIKERINEMLEFAEKGRVARIILAGDMFRDKHPSMLHLEIFSQTIKRIIDLKIPTLILPGNHDVNRVRGTAHALTPFMPLIKNSCVEIIDQPAVRDDISLFPYMSAPQEPPLKEFLKKVPTSCRFLALHGTVKGAVMNKLVDYEIYDEDTMSPDLMDRFQMVFAGHIHDAQQFRNVIYPGSIERLDFGDEFSNKSFVYLLDDKNVEIIPLKARQMTTITYQNLRDHYKEIPFKDAIVRVTNADKLYIPDVRRWLAERGCYYIAGISTMDTSRQETETREMLDTPKFIKQFAEKVKYDGDMESVTRTIMEMLDAQA